MNQSLRAVWIVALWFVASAVHGATLSIYTESFIGWASYRSLFTSNGHGGYLERLATGGNSGSYLRFLSQPSEHVQGIGSWAMHTAATGRLAIDPATSGAIRSLSFSQDVKLFGGTASEIETGLMLQQGGKVYVNRWPMAAGQAWTSRSRDRLNSTDFIAVSTAPEGGFDEASRPDFSSHADPIVLGSYFLGLRFPASTTSAAIGIDNWRVDVDFVPEPGAVLSAAIAATGVAPLRRRR